MGVAMTLFLALALIALLADRPVKIHLSRAICIGASAVLFAAVLPSVMFLTPRALAAGSEIARAGEALRKVESGGTAGIGTRLLSDALLDSKAAQEHNPLDPRGYDLYARGEFLFWKALRDLKTPAEKLQEKEWIILKAIDNAIRLRPYAAVYPARKASFHRGFLHHYRELHQKDPRAGHDLTAEVHLREGLSLQRRAVELYPTRAMAHYDLGRMLDLDGKPEAAETRYQEAMRLSDLASEMMQHRLQLGPLQHARCLKRTGRPLAAHDRLTSHLRKMFSQLDPESAKRASELLQKQPQLLGAPADELDDLMKPVLKSALDVIIAEREAESPR
jgi:tetratricopeptide (TPR) repeat protein